MQSKSSNRSFGLLFFIIFLTLGLWPILKNNEANYYLLTISFIFLILGLINSKLLSPFNNYWVKLGEILGNIIAPIIMAFVYFAILTPISLILRLFGKDLLDLKFFNERKTYWKKRKNKMSSMKKQF